MSDVVEDFRAETIIGLVMSSCPEGTYPEQWDVERLKDNVREVLDLDPPFDTWLQEEEVEQAIIIERLQEQANAKMAAKLETMSSSFSTENETLAFLAAVPAMTPVTITWSTVLVSLLSWAAGFAAAALGGAAVCAYAPCADNALAPATSARTM